MFSCSMSSVARRDRWKGHIRVDNATQGELTRNNDMGAFLLMKISTNQRGSSSRCRCRHFRLLIAAPLQCPLMLPLAPSVLPPCSLTGPSKAALLPFLNEKGNSNLGSRITFLSQEREYGCFGGSSEGARGSRGEHEGRSRGRGSVRRA